MYKNQTKVTLNSLIEEFYESTEKIEPTKKIFELLTNLSLTENDSNLLSKFLLSWISNVEEYLDTNVSSVSLMSDFLAMNIFVDLSLV